MKYGASSRRSSAAGDCYSQRSEDVEQPLKTPPSTIASTVSRLKKQVELYRSSYVKARTEANNKKLHGYTAHLLSLGEKHALAPSNTSGSESTDLLTVQIEKSVYKVPGLDAYALDKEGSANYEEGINAFMSILSGNGQGGKSAVRPVKLPATQKYPPYTTWIFLDRNQKMPEDQSVVGRRRIYYDQNGSEALIASDSEEEQVDEEDDRHEFSKGEDYILWKAIQEHGPSEALLKSLGNCVGANPEEIEARYEALQKGDLDRDFLVHECLLSGQTEGDCDKKADSKDEVQMTELLINAREESSLEDKDLDAAMDSFDNLFCRRCLVFDCRLHGCSQAVNQPSEKQPPWMSSEGALTPCGPDCYLLKSRQSPVELQTSSLERGEMGKRGLSVADSMTLKSPSCVNEKGHQSNALKDKGSLVEERLQVEPLRRGRKPKKSPKRRAEELLESIRKKQNIVAASDGELTTNGPSSPKNRMEVLKPKVHTRLIPHREGLRTTGKKTIKKQDILHESYAQIEEESTGRKVEMDMQINSEKSIIEETSKEMQSLCDETMGHAKDSPKTVESMKWSKLEKGLYEKGLEMFGKNSCLVARNLLQGLKTCKEVAAYTTEIERATQFKLKDAQNSFYGSGRAVSRDEAMDVEVRARTRFWRKRGRVRRLKYTWKSAGHPAIKKRTVDSKDQPCRQYTPCNCQFICGKQCTCLHSGTCCEKYCGCSRSCKNRFRGCHCAKSQCRSRQCPCFAAGRECDPDVCRNCWVGCGDGTLGGPPQRGDNYECQNMKLLLRQQQRVLLGRSDVAGWGAFLKNSVSRHDYLGEYTGELISHKEADKRGKIYDRENSSFLFNLNDQYVLDAYRKGDKLKFANHSPHPNCYAKVIMVGGDHRVGIFAKDRILAGEELFYDYRYEPDRAPVWAKKPEGSTSKKDEACVTSGRAQKVA